MKTNFNYFIEFQRKSGYPINTENDVLKFVMKAINKIEEEKGKLIADFTPNETLEWLESYSKATVRNIRPFLVKYFNYCIIAGYMEANYILLDKRFSLSNLSYSIKMNFYTVEEFNNLIEDSKYSLEEKAILYGYWMGLDTHELAGLKKSMISREKLFITLINKTVVIDKKYLQLLDEMNELMTRLGTKIGSGKDVDYPLNTYKDYVYKYVSIRVLFGDNDDEKFINSQKRMLRKLIQKNENTNFDVRDIRISGVINYVCDYCKKEDFEGTINVKLIEEALKDKGMSCSGWWFARTYKAQIHQYYKNKGIK